MDEIPASGLKISPERRRELLRLSGQGDSDDEITESISELPSISTSAKPRSAKKSVKLAIDEEVKLLIILIDNKLLFIYVLIHVVYVN